MLSQAAMRISRHLSRIFLFILLSVVFQCTKSSDPSPVIAGTWNFVNTVYSSCNNSANNQTFTSAGTSITFTATTFVTTGPNASSGTYTLTGSSITFSGNASPQPSTVTVSGATMTFVNRDSFTGCTITSTWRK